ncbi:hypothetical protein EE612_054392, partial [Oryza sativa]
GGRGGVELRHARHALLPPPLVLLLDLPLHLLERALHGAAGGATPTDARRGRNASAAPRAPMASSAAARAPASASSVCASPCLCCCCCCLACVSALSPSLRRLEPHLASSAPHRRSTASHSANAAAARRRAVTAAAPSPSQCSATRIDETYPRIISSLSLSPAHASSSSAAS